MDVDSGAGAASVATTSFGQFLVLVVVFLFLFVADDVLLAADAVTFRQSNGGGDNRILLRPPISDMGVRVRFEVVENFLLVNLPRSPRAASKGRLVDCRSVINVLRGGWHKTVKDDDRFFDASTALVDDFGKSLRFVDERTIFLCFSKRKCCKNTDR